MKKNILLALTAAMLLSATACSGGGKESSGNVSAPNTTSSPSTTSSAEESTPAADDVIKPDESKEFSGLAGFETAPNNTNLTAGGSFCDAEDGFYYADESGIYHVSRDKTEQIYEGKAASLCMRRDMLYFLQEFGNICVYSGGTVTTAVVCEAISLAASSSGTYYIDAEYNLHKIYGADTVISSEKVSNLNIAGDYVVFSETATDRLCAYNSADDSIITIAEKGRVPVVSGDKVYYVNDDGALASTNLADGTAEVIADNCDDGIAVGTDALYYVSGAKILSVSDGEPSEVYAAADEAAELTALSLCDDVLYFTENGVVMQLLDGTASEFTVTISE